MIARIGKIRKKKGAHFEMKDCGERAKRIHNGGKVTRHQREILQIDKTQKNSDFKTLPDFSPLCSLSNPHFSDSEGVSRKKKKVVFPPFIQSGVSKSSSLEKQSNVTLSTSEKRNQSEKEQEAFEMLNVSP